MHDIMNIFSFILTVLSVIYLFLGFKVIQLDKRSLLNRLFFALNLTLIIWSVASAFYISAYDEASCIFWYKLSSVGFNLFIGIGLHFFLVYTKKVSLLKHWWMYIIIYVPAIIISYMEIAFDTYVESYFHGSNGWIINAQIESIWFWASIAYTIVYICAIIVIISRFQKTSVFQRERRQAKVLIITATISLLAGLIIMVLTSILESNIPDATPICIAVWLIGIYYSIKYKNACCSSDSLSSCSLSFMMACLESEHVSKRAQAKANAYLLSLVSVRPTE